MLRTAEFPTDRGAIEELLGAVAAADGYPPLSEEPRLDLERGPNRAGLLAVLGGEVAGYAHLRDARDAVVIDLAVRPEHRPALIPDLVSAAREAAGSSPVRLWAADDITAEAARRIGLTESRSVVRLQCALPPQERAERAGEARIVLFRSGVDEAAYLIVSNEAFEGHPDSGAWDAAVLADRMQREWFDPEGVFLAWERGRPVGLCLTKLHPDGLGEIYSVAVRPDAGGRGLGRELTLRGLWYLSRHRGAGSGLVYTEEGNGAAMKVYRSLGFRPIRSRLELVG